MASEPENLTLIYLRRIDEKVDRLIDDMNVVKARLTGVEENLAGVHRRIDRLEVRVERIERRLDLTEAHS
jgi:archaellum component FlaC